MSSYLLWELGAIKLAATRVVQPTRRTPVGYGVALVKLEGRVHPGRQRTLAAAERERVEQQVQLVDQVVLEQRVHELAAAIGQDGLARLRLERADRFDRRCRE